MRANGIAFAATLLLAGAASAQRSASVAVGYSTSVSSKEAVLEFELSDGSTAKIALSGGLVLVDGKRVGNYRPSGAFEQSFRELLKQNSTAGAAAMLAAAQAWKPAGIRPDVANIPLAIHSRLAVLQAAPVPSAAPLPPAQPAVPVPAESPPNATPLPDVIIGPAAIARAVSVGVSPRFGEPAMSAWRLIADGIASLVGAFTALAALGFGFTYFAPRQLEVVADTTIKSFGR